MLISKISKVKTDSYLNDSGAAVLTLYEKYGANLLKMMRESDHGKILLENGFMKKRYASINDLKIDEEERRVK